MSKKEAKVNWFLTRVKNKTNHLKAKKSFRNSELMMEEDLSTNIMNIMNIADKLEKKMTVNLLSEAELDDNNKDKVRSKNIDSDNKGNKEQRKPKTSKDNIIKQKVTDILLLKLTIPKNAKLRKKAGKPEF